MRQFIDRAIYLTEHRFFPSWTRTLSEECVVIRVVVAACPIVFWQRTAVIEDVAFTPRRPQPRR